MRVFSRKNYWLEFPRVNECVDVYVRVYVSMCLYLCCVCMCVLVYFISWSDSSFVWLLANRFCGNWVPKVVIKLCSNFGSQSFVILSNNSCNSEGPYLKVFSRVLFQQECFSLFPLKGCITFEAVLPDTQNIPTVFITLVSAIRTPAFDLF